MQTEAKETNDDRLYEYEFSMLGIENGGFLRSGRMLRAFLGFFGFYSPRCLLTHLLELRAERKTKGPKD